MSRPGGRNDPLAEIGAILVEGWLRMAGNRAAAEAGEPERIASNPLAMEAEDEPISSEPKTPVTRSNKGG